MKEFCENAGERRERRERERASEVTKELCWKALNVYNGKLPSVHLYVGLKLLPLVSRKSRLIIRSLTDILTFSEIFKCWEKNILPVLLKIFSNLALCDDERC